MAVTSNQPGASAVSWHPLAVAREQHTALKGQCPASSGAALFAAYRSDSSGGLGLEAVGTSDANLWRFIPDGDVRESLQPL